MNGLKLKNIETRSSFLKLNIKNWQQIHSIIDKYFPGEESYIVSYLDYKVLIGKFIQGRLVFYNEEIFNPEFLVKMRVFNQNKELLLWREIGQQYSARLRIDGEGSNSYLVEAEQLLWGRSKFVNKEWILLSELRGTEFYLPYRLEKADNNRFMIKTYNYIDYNNLGQAGYVDCRFVIFFEEGYDCERKTTK